MTSTSIKERPGTVKVLAFDSDGHLTEPPEIFERYIDPMYRDRLKRLGLQYSAAGGLAGGTLGKYEDVVDPEKAKHMKGHPGGYDPRARLKVFEEEEYYGAVLYPSTMLRWYHDPFLWTAMARAYNRWTGEEFCSVDRSRLHAAVAVNLEDIRGAVDELARCVKEYGSRAVALRPNAYGGLKWNHPAYDVFWAACQEMDVAIGLHPFPTDDAPGFNKGFNMLTVEKDPPGGGLEFFLRNPMSNIVDNLFTLGYILVGGVLDRFPKLRFGVMESNGGWLCAFLDRLDHRMEHFRYQVPWMRMLPSEYFKQSCYISCDPDESMFERTVEVLGSDRIIWGSDFPHPDAFYPGIVHMLKRSMPNLSEEEQAKVLGNSGFRFYNLEVHT